MRTQWTQCLQMNFFFLPDNCVSIPVSRRPYVTSSFRHPSSLSAARWHCLLLWSTALVSYLVSHPTNRISNRQLSSHISPNLNKRPMRTHAPSLASAFNRTRASSRCAWRRVRPAFQPSFVIQWSLLPPLQGSTLISLIGALWCYLPLCRAFRYP